MARSRDIFMTIHTEGALLPPDLLQRITKGDGDLEGLTPADYHLSGERLNEATNHAWNRLQGAWAAFKLAREKLPAGDIGTSLTRERWLLPLFAALDYGRLETARAVEIDGKSYPISHRWRNVPMHLVGYQLDLDRRTARVSGAATASPHSLLQVYLNRSDETLWGFLSNGLRLRILRDNASLTRQAYVEFDLEAMMDGEVYADFVLLYLLCHQSRVEADRPADFWLEKWMNAAQQQGIRALDQLRDGVQNAIKCLGAGFIGHPANHELRGSLRSGALSRQDFYRQLLRLVYRLVFLFTAEDRGLLHPKGINEATRRRYHDYYSARRLREIASRIRGTRHPDLFEGLRLVMRLLSGEAPYTNEHRALLGLPALNSWLFRDESAAAVIDCQISNRDLLDAIRALAFTEDRAARVLRPVDYKNLGPEELGSVYESLLELHPDINIEARLFILNTAAGHERKTTGSYYTPDSLVQALLDSALNPLIEERKNSEAALLDLKICDPACGSGHFLIAAAHRVAKVVATLRTGEEEPPPEMLRHALRDVIGRCVYGVDINPMAVELCKVNLWIEALDPDKPLAFLDHRIQCGNSLLGTTPALIAQGIPDDAFQPIEGDDSQFAAGLRRQNRAERGGQTNMFAMLESRTDTAALAAGLRRLDTLPDDTVEGVQARENAYYQLEESYEYQRRRFLADAWCAAFVWEKTAEALVHPMTDLLFRRLTSAGDLWSFEGIDAIADVVERLARQYRFFHWHVAFPDVFDVPEQIEDAENEISGWNGGFDCMLGNPPWEMVELSEKEFFASRDPAIADAPTARQRQHMIKALKMQNQALYHEYRQAKRKIYSYRHFVQSSGRYPFSSTGRINLYPLFGEASAVVISQTGYVGLIIPSAISMDAYNAQLFSWLVEDGRFRSLLDFENRNALFPGVHRSYRFCILTLSGKSVAKASFRFCYFCHDVSELRDAARRIILSPEELVLFSPNTLAPPILQNATDLRLARATYRRWGVLINKRESTNPWDMTIQRMLSLSDAGDLFRKITEMNDLPERDRGVTWTRLFSGKSIHHFDHRYATWDATDWRECTLAEHMNPSMSVTTEYYAREDEVLIRLSGKQPSDWLLVYRDVTNATNETTAIAAILPQVGCDTTCRNIFSDGVPLSLLGCFLGNFNCFALNYFARQKTIGLHLNASVLEQLPFLPPTIYAVSLLAFLTPHVLELTYTAWDLRPFAQDIGYSGPPFIWDEDRRFLLRCELDALYFHLYQIARDDVDYIMETFPIVKRKDEATYGEYRTKRVILQMYDQMAALPQVSVPNPKGLNEEYLVPDVSRFETWLNPPPADPSVAHPPRE